MSPKGPSQSGPPGYRKRGPPALVRPESMRVNGVMRKSFFSGLLSAPLAATLAAVSVVITFLVALGAVTGGRASTAVPLGLIMALLIAAVATVAATRPAPRHRDHPPTSVTRPGDEQQPQPSRGQPD